MLKTKLVIACDKIIGKPILDLRNDRAYSYATKVVHR